MSDLQFAKEILTEHGVDHLKDAVECYGIDGAMEYLEECEDINLTVGLRKKVTSWLNRL